MKKKLLKSFLLAVTLVVGTSAWGAVTWDFTNSAIWGTVTLPSAGTPSISYKSDGTLYTSGDDKYVTFYSTEGKITHPSTKTNGISWTTAGSTSDHYVKLSVPAGSTVTVMGYFSSNRNLIVNFNNTTTSLTSGGWGEYSKDFINNTSNALDLYIYANGNNGQNDAPYLRKIELKTTVPVTINYRDKADQTNTLIPSVVVNVEVGTNYTPTYTSPLYVSDSDPYEYTYDSGATETTINATTSFNILYSKANRDNYNYTVNAIKNDGDKAVIKQLASGSMYKGASVKVPYPACFNVGGTLYARGTTSSEYRQSFSATKDNEVKTFPYVAQSTTNVVYLIEGEDIAGVTKNTTGTNVAVRSSNAAAASIPAGGVAICTLPAGTYQLHLFMHHTRNDASVTTTFGYGETEFTIETSGTNRVEAAVKEFTLGETSELRCKSISGNGLLDNLYITGDISVANAKAVLNAEIDAATTVKNTWTNKVGTTPFKYNSTYYDALVTELSEANAVKDGGSETISDYLIANNELKAAKEAITSSTLNLPAADKYYRLFLAQDGASTGKNLKMLEHGNGKAVLSATPYPVKFVSDGEGNYFIENPYDYYIATTRESNSYWGVYTGLGEDDNQALDPSHNPAEYMYAKANVWSASLQENGTFKLMSQQATWSGWNWRLGAWSTDENSFVAPYDVTRDNATKDNPTYDTWLCSNAVEITDVNLAVNATTAWGTFIAPYDNLTPSTVKAFTVSHKEGGSIYLEENETGVLSANTPYILSTEESSNVSVAFKGIAVNNQNTYEVNGLVGLLAEETVPANSYILQYQSDKDGTAFYKLASNMTGTKYRCYLNMGNVPASSGSSRAFVCLGIEGDETGIGNIEVTETTAKNGVYVEDGKIVIYKKGMKFNAVGVKL